MRKPEKTRIAVAVSGGGRSLENFLAEQDAPFEIAAVISSNPNSRARLIAEEHGLPVYLFDSKSLNPNDLESWLLGLGVEWIALAGFLKIFPSMPSFEGKTVNIHPSLLPKFGGHGMYGLRVHTAVHAAHEKFSGATIHFVNERYDEGAIIAQGEVDVSMESSAEAIAAKVFALECRLYPLVLAKLVRGELPLTNGQTWLMKAE